MTDRSTRKRRNEKTHEEEPILAKKRVLRFPIPNKLVLLFGGAATEGTGEETSSNFAVPLLSCSRISSEVTKSK